MNNFMKITLSILKLSLSIHKACTSTSIFILSVEFLLKFLSSSPLFTYYNFFVDI